MTVELKPLNDAIGVEVLGVDLSREMNDEDFADITAA